MISLSPGRLRPIARCGWLLVSFSFALSLPAEVTVLKQAVVPNRIFPGVWVLSSAWAGQIPPSGSVNAPVQLTSLYPGQKIALALVCEGSDRDRLLRETKITARFVSPGRGTTEVRDLKPVAIRRIKAEGADMAMRVLTAGGVAPQEGTVLKDAMATVSFAIFQPDWTAPSAAQPEDVRINVTIATSAPAVPATDVTLPLRPTADWLKGPTPTMQEYSQYMNCYREDLAPGRLLAFLKGAAAEDKIDNLAVASFFAVAYRGNAVARRAAVDLLPTLDGRTQMALLFVLRFGGQDVSGLTGTAPPGAMVALQAVESLKDPRARLAFHEPVTPEAVRDNGNTMDQCWAGWMATGDPSYLRAMVGVLAWAPDYATFQTWLKLRRGAAGFNASVARGIAYQIAGWSIGSFQRTDPHATDWLLYWSNDPTFPPALRREITAIPTNPAFKRN